MAIHRFNSAKDVASEHQKLGLPKNFCLVPFTTLILEPDGLVGSCRHKGCEFPVGNIKTQTLEEIWNGESIRKWRKEFIEGNVKTCETEVRHRACHLCPDYNSMLPIISVDELQKDYPLRLGLNFNGHCNLECRMCHVWQKPNGLYDEIGFWDKLKKFAPTLREVELLSGEPFIQKDTYRLIDLIGDLNPSCLWTITTNAHWKLTPAIERSLDKIRVKNLIISLDSLNPQTYSEIRKKGKLETVLENIDRLRQYDRSRKAGSLNIRVNFLIQRDNWNELASIHAFGKEKGLEVFRTFLYEPEQYSLLTLDQETKESILDFYLNHLTREQLAQSMRIILPIADSLPKDARCDFWLRFKDRVT